MDKEKLEKAIKIIEDKLKIMKESKYSRISYYDKDDMKHIWDFEYLIPEIEELLEMLKGGINNV